MSPPRGARHPNMLSDLGSTASNVATRLSRPSWKKKKGNAATWSEHHTYDKAQERVAQSAISKYANSQKERWHFGGASKTNHTEVQFKRTSGLDASCMVSGPGAQPSWANKDLKKLDFGAFSAVESYQHVGEDSKVHLDMRVEHNSSTEQQKLDYATVFLIAGIAVSVGCIAVCIVAAEVLLHDGVRGATEKIMHSKGDHAPAAAELFAAYSCFLCLQLTLISCAAGLTVFWAPTAAGSGLPQLKAFLNGCHVGDILKWQTVTAKVFGIILIVASGLPMGREGPMVSIGAGVGLFLSHHFSRIFGMAGVMSMRLPAKQRNWVGMGAAAGVAAAFVAPVGGILYSFEEVCSSWSETLTWWSFACTILTFFTVHFCTEISPWLDHHIENWVIGLSGERLQANVTDGTVGWMMLLAALGGILGACYNLCVFRVKRMRIRWEGSSGRPKLHKMVEVILFMGVAFTFVFWIPTWWDSCRDCPPNSNGEPDCHLYATASVCDGDEEPRLPLVRWNCAKHEYSQMGTLLHGGQEALLKHLLAREPVAEFSPGTIASMLGIYFCLAVFVFGCAVPAGQFVPGLTMGALLGRILAEILLLGDLCSERDRGTYALVGAAAVISGMTRMTLTIAVILTELSKDAFMLPALMIGSCCARIVADSICHGFDHGMIHMLKLPFLDEAPPRTLEVLTARDVMASPVIGLPKIASVKDILAVLRTSHNGFPIISHPEDERRAQLAQHAADQRSASAAESDRDGSAAESYREGEIAPDDQSTEPQSSGPPSPPRSPPEDCQHACAQPTQAVPTSHPTMACRPPDLSMRLGRRGSTGLEKGGVIIHGIILRRQLHALLKARVWTTQHLEEVPLRTQRIFLTSFINMAELAEEVANKSFLRDDSELEARIDLRPFTDAAPFMVNTLMPLPRVYRLFNEMGVRHVPVLNSLRELVGIITRKDVMPETIAARISLGDAHIPSAANTSSTTSPKLHASSLGHAASEPAAAPPPVSPPSPNDSSSDHGGGPSSSPMLTLAQAELANSEGKGATKLAASLSVEKV